MNRKWEHYIDEKVVSQDLYSSSHEKLVSSN